MKTAQRKIARRIAQKHRSSEKPLGWFEAFYTRAYGNPDKIPFKCCPQICGPRPCTLWHLFLAPGETALVITRGREPHEPMGEMPWPRTRDELLRFEKQGLKPVEFEDY